MSLRLRIILLFVAAELLLVFVFAAGSFMFVQRRLIKSFDAALVANAEAIATLVHEEHETESLELELSDEVMSRFSRRKHPDLFCVLRADGSTVEKSKSLKSIPEFVKAEDEKTLSNFRALNDDYRGILLPARAQPDDEDEEGKTAEIMVFFATSREDLDDDLKDILSFLMIAAGVTMLLSTFAAFWIAKRGLRPLHALGVEAGGINARTLDRRFALGDLPSDIRPLANSFNALLSRLEESFERERRFSADAAHELRTPVAVLKSGIQAALLSPADSQHDREAMNEVLEDVARIEELCESLLLLGRPGTGDEKAARISAGEFHEQIRQVVASLAASAETRGSIIALHIPNNAGGSVCCDSATARRILTNLIGNALRHSMGSVQVQVIVTKSEDGGLTVSVEDDGPGISAAFRPRLFERFARGDESRTRATGGAGLGLAISRALAERFGGGLALEDPRELRGARFVWRVAPAPDSQ
ncbi:ATP-binding protein [soil metagenome]